jgi:hypothetical protein
MFAIHQVIVLWVIVLSAPIIAAQVFNLLRLLGWQRAGSAYHWLVSGNPYFPASVVIALLLGWLLGRSFRDPSMQWIWVVPSAVMLYVLTSIPTLIPNLVRPEFQARVGQSPFLHYFGWNCGLGNYCLDQTSITRPFYTSVAYSLAAMLALKTTRNRSGNTAIHRLTVVLVGALFVMAAVYDCILSVSIGGWNWMYLSVSGVPTAMGLFLILLAVRLRQEGLAVTRQPTHT